MTIEGFEITNYTEEQIKTAMGYSDKVHRDVNGEIVELDNPLTIEQYIQQEARGHVINKLEGLGKRCC